MDTPYKISCIMPSLLEEFPGSAKNRKDKFVRAVDSFLSNTFSNKELIIVSDGCPYTPDLTKRRYSRALKNGEIHLIEIQKKEPREYFVGAIRQQGIEWATGDVLCNLDSDDYFLPNHLHNISCTFDPNKHDWAYFNYVRKLDQLKSVEELVEAKPTLDGLCTVNVVWRKGLDVSWNNCNGRQDNKEFNSQLLEKYPNFTQIYGCGYVVANANITS